MGYIDSSLSEFNTSDYRDDMKSDADEKHPETCQYRGYRNGPDHVDPYGLSPQYWHVFAARLAFVVVFEHVVSLDDPSLLLTTTKQTFAYSLYLKTHQPSTLSRIVKREINLIFLFFETQVFALTGIMSYVIPAVPHSLSTQLQRERLLAQEAKYEKGIKGKEDEDDLISVLREAGTIGRTAGGGAGRGNWAGRRFSKLSDGLDAHVDVGIRHSKRSDSSTVWEVT